MAASPRESGSSNALKNCCGRTVCTGCSRADRLSSGFDLPYSRLLQECLDYAEQYNRCGTEPPFLYKMIDNFCIKKRPFLLAPFPSIRPKGSVAKTGSGQKRQGGNTEARKRRLFPCRVKVFDSPCLQAIVQHKWDSSCRFIFYVRFASILCFTTLLTVVVVNDGWSEHLFYDIARWACIGFSVLLIKSGLHELFMRGLFAFLADSRNWVETYIAAASFVSLIGMELQARRETAPDGVALASEPSGGGSAAGASGDYAGTRFATMQAILMLLVWLRLAKWCGSVSFAMPFSY
eukprot:COSAG06_NODE_1307_length_9916_cov_99.462361_21_plen_292_part_00